MTNQSSLISIIIIILISLNLVLLLVYYFEYRRNQKLLGISKKSNEADRLYKKSQDSAHNLLNQTIQESQLIIERAYHEANNITNQMKKTMQNLDEKTTAEMSALVETGKVSLQKEIEVFSAEFKNSLTKIGNTQTQEVSKLQAQIYQETLNSLHELIAKLKDQSLSIQESAGQQTQEQIKLLQAELTTYKASQIAKVNANLYDIILKTAKRLLGEGVSLDLKKESVLKAIDDAKKDGLIS